MQSSKEWFFWKDRRAFCEGCSDLGLYDPQLDGCPVCRGKNAHELSARKFSGSQLHHDRHLGYYDSTIEAVSRTYQQRSSAGGLATALIHLLLEENIVDYAITVSFDSCSQSFVYKKFTSASDLHNQQRSAYFPVKLDGALAQIRQEPGICVITGIPAAIKAIEHIKNSDPSFAKKVKYTIGLVSGGIKIQDYTDYMCRKAGKEDGLKNISYVSYRDKPESGLYRGDNYLFRAKSDDTTYEVHSSTMPMNWPSGLLKSFASDFCDDTFNIVSDIAIMDAWRPQYFESKGVSLAIVRDRRLTDLILRSDDMDAKEIEPKEVLLSQIGGVRHKTIGLKARVKIYRLLGNRVDLPLVLPEASPHLLVYAEQVLRLWTSYLSRVVYRRTLSFEAVERRLEPFLSALRYVNRRMHARGWGKQKLE